MTWSVTLILWFVVLVLLLRQLWSGKAPLAGLLLCYWLNLASHHLVTEILCLLHVNQSEYRWATDIGFPITGYAMLGLLIGGWGLPYLFFRLPAIQVAPRTISTVSPTPDLAAAALAIPFGFLIFMFGRLIPIPSINAATFGGNMLAAAGFAWLIVMYYRSGRVVAAGWVMALAMMAPICTMLLQGFLGYGMMTLMVIVAVIMAAIRLRRRTIIRLVIVGLLVIYLMLSLLVTYMAGRVDIRESVWERREDIDDRVSVAADVFADRWMWFDPWDEQQRLSLDTRFNQNYFSGLNKSIIDSGHGHYQNGATFIDGIIAMVPRIVWPSKPPVSGGSEQMAMMTGLRFKEGVTFGVGHVLELHANFGRGGVFLGFAFLSFAIVFIDRRAGYYLASARLANFLVWFVPGTALVNGALARSTEITTSFLGFLGLAAGFNWMCRAVFPDSEVAGR